MSMYDDDDDEDYDPREFRTSVQILNSTTGKRTVTQIKVKPRRDSDNNSRCSGFDNNNSYKALSSASSVKNLLLYYGSSSSRALVFYSRYYYQIYRPKCKNQESQQK